MIFSSGNVRIIDLVKVGFIMKLFGIMIILFFSMIVLPPIFRIHQITLFLNDTFTINGNHSQQIQITTTN